MTQYHGGTPYRPNPVPFNEKDLPRYLSAEFDRISNILGDLGKVSWGGTYETGLCYAKGTQIQDDGWTMIANKDTCDRPAPQPIGIPTWTLPEVPVWSSEEVEASTLSTGQRYTYSEAGFINGIRVWLPVASENTYYRVVMTGDPEGASPRVSILADWFTTTTVGWNLLGVNQTPVISGLPFELVLQTQNRTGQIQFAGAYSYSNPGNTTPPIDGQITHDNQNNDLMLISKFDADQNDLSANLGTLQLGDEIQGAGRTWQVQSNTDQGLYHQYTVIPAIQGSPVGLQPFNFTHFADQPVPYVEIVDHWQAVPNIEGLIAVTINQPGANVLNNNAYGTDINLQAASVSEDWDLVSAP